MSCSGGAPHATCSAANTNASPPAMARNRTVSTGIDLPSCSLDVQESQSEENQRYSDQSHAGNLLRPLSYLLAQPGAKPEPDLGRGERLDRDPDHGQGDGQAEQPGAQADGQLVDADAQTQVEDGQAAGMGQQAEALLLLRVVLARPKEEEPCDEEEHDPAVAGPGADQVAGNPPDEDAGDGHARFKDREHEGDAQPVWLLEPGHAQGGGEREGVEGEGEEEAGGQEQLAHRRELNNRGLRPERSFGTMRSRTCVRWQSRSSFGGSSAPSRRPGSGLRRSRWSAARPDRAWTGSRSSPTTCASPGAGKAWRGRWSRPWTVTSRIHCAGSTWRSPGLARRGPTWSCCTATSRPRRCPWKSSCAAWTPSRPSSAPPSHDRDQRHGLGLRGRLCRRRRLHRRGPVVRRQTWSVPIQRQRGSCKPRPGGPRMDERCLVWFRGRSFRWEWS